MHFDFPTLMVLAVFFTGTVWALDALFWAPKRRAKAATLVQGDKTSDRFKEDQSRLLKEPIIVEYSRSLFPVILIVLLLRSFLIEPFRIPSGSMMPTLLDGDFILVNKFTYGIRLPVVDKKIIKIGEPQRGDVIVFRYPNEPSIDYIKRVVGLPGDKITYLNKQLYVNDVLMGQVDEGAYDASGAGIAMAGAKLKLENLGEMKHHILISNDKPIMNIELTVESGQYFVMGDNRDNSNDSRFWGTVPEENLVGRAFMIWMNWDSTNSGVTWSRLGKSII
ncbi:MAG: signal peptidase I [Gammaproteobacteria bacterium]|nr:signal peptidase I [Gammaproteobacteria bacterium]